MACHPKSIRFVQCDGSSSRNQAGHALPVDQYRIKSHGSLFSPYVLSQRSGISQTKKAAMVCIPLPRPFFHSIRIIRALARHKLSQSRSSDSHVPENDSFRTDSPSRVSPMAGFRHDLSVRAYSGGTVRELHTVPYSSDAVPAASDTVRHMFPHPDSGYGLC